MTEVVTGEAVILDVACARFPSRIAAVLLDLLIQGILLLGALVGAFLATGHVDPAGAAAITVASFAAIVVGYSTAFETLTRGRTPGKMALGLRVISDDGGPVRFRQALVRALTGAIEIWTVIGAPIGLITSMVSAKGKRVGDIFAGTYVIQERVPRRPDLLPMFATVPAPLLGWAQVAEMSRLSDQNAEAAGSYLRRLYELSPAARDQLGLRIATAVASQVSPPPPPGTPPAAYLAAVLAIRRQRDQARLASQVAGPPPHVQQQPAAWPPTAPPAAPQSGDPQPSGTQPWVSPQSTPGWPAPEHAGLVSPAPGADAPRHAPEPGAPEATAGGFAPPG